MNANKIQAVILVGGLMLVAFSLTPAETGCSRVGFEDAGQRDDGYADDGDADEVHTDDGGANDVNVDEGYSDEGAVTLPLIATEDLPLALAGQSYQTTLTATDGIPPYTWTIVSGNLPTGITLDSQSGTLSGTPSEAGDCFPVFQVTDTLLQTNDKNLTLHCDRVEQRTIFLWAWTVDTKEKADAVYDELQGMHANVVDFLAFWHGAYYRTTNPDIHQESDVTADFDPLGYAVEALHSRGIAVHATLAFGEFPSSDPAIINHPEWSSLGPAGQLYSEQNGNGIDWLDLGNPATHPFLSSVILEVAQNYDVDGILLTYIGYPSDVIWGFSSYHRNEFFLRTGLDSNRLTASSMPTVVKCEGNQLKTPTTAQVLATFSTGTPAVLLNSPDGGVAFGESVLLNWKAEGSQMPAVDSILQNSVAYLNKTNLLVLDSPNDSWKTVSVWLTRLGFSPTSITLADLPTNCQSEDNLIIIPMVYYWNETDASALEQCFNTRNSVINIDGPTSSIENGTVGAHLQAILGLSQRGSYLPNAVYSMQTTQPHPILPPVDGSTSESELVDMWSAWVAYMIDAVTGCVTQISSDAKPALPDRYLGVIVPPLFYYVPECFTQWSSWYASGFFDYYLNFLNWEVSLAQYQQGIAEQKTVDPDLTRVFPGITAYPSNVTPDGLSTLVDAGRQGGSRVIFFYRYEDLSTEKKNLLSTTLWPHIVPAYNPPLIRP